MNKCALPPNPVQLLLHLPLNFVKSLFYFNELYCCLSLLGEEYMSPFMQLFVHLNSAIGNWAIENQEKQKLPDME